MAFLNYTPVKKHHCDFPLITGDLLDEAKEMHSKNKESILWKCDECDKIYALYVDRNWGQHKWIEKLV